MKKINSDLITFSGLFIVLSYVSFFICKPIFFQKNIASCQKFIQTLNIFDFFTVILYFFCFVLLLQIGILVYKFLTVKALIHKKTPFIASFLRKSDLVGKVFIVNSEKQFAFCFGFYNPKIYISVKTKKIMAKEELEAIIFHEKYHMDHKDPLILLIATSLYIFFPFFPLIIDLIEKYKLRREVSADNEAINMLKNKSPLITALKKMLTVSITPAFSAGFNQDNLSERLEMLILEKKQTKSFKNKNIFISCCTLMVLLILHVVPVNAQEIYLHDHKEFVLCFDKTSQGFYQNVSLPFSKNDNLPIDK